MEKLTAEQSQNHTFLFSSTNIVVMRKAWIIIKKEIKKVDRWYIHVQTLYLSILKCPMFIPSRSLLCKHL